MSFHSLKNKIVQPVVILGKGNLANALQHKWSQAGCLSVQVTHKKSCWHFDLSRSPDCWRIPHPARWVFVCAGITSREICDRDPWRSRWVNVIGGIRVARYFERKGAQVVFFGTDLLPEEGEYARQKEELRRAVAGMSHCYWIRLAKIIHPALPIFQKWLDSLKAGKRPKAFQNVALRAISLEAVAECAWRMANGFYSSCREASWLPDQEISYLNLANRWLAWQGRAGISAEPAMQEAFTRKQTNQRESSYQPFAGVIRATDAEKWWNS